MHRNILLVRADIGQVWARPADHISAEVLTNWQGSSCMSDVDEEDGAEPCLQ